MKSKGKNTIIAISIIVAAAILFGLIILGFILVLAQGYLGYKEPFTAEYTEAVYSLLDAKGYWVYGEPICDPYLKVLEKDNFGRTLFAYCEYNRVSSLSLMILQKSDGVFSYYYTDCNFTASETFISGEPNFDIADTIQVNDENVLSFFTGEQIDELKNLNDWNKEINTGKCVKKEIINKKDFPKITRAQKDSFDLICKKIAKDCGCKGNDSVYRYATALDTDDYGRTIYYVYGIHRDVDGEGISPTSKKMELDMVIIMNSNGSYDINTCGIKLKDTQNYQTELQKFKQLNSWNKAL